MRGNQFVDPLALPPVMSGSDEIERVGACIASGAAMYLIKPLEKRVLKHIWQVRHTLAWSISPPELALCGELVRLGARHE